MEVEARQVEKLRSRGHGGEVEVEGRLIVGGWEGLVEAVMWRDGGEEGIVWAEWKENKKKKVDEKEGKEKVDV